MGPFEGPYLVNPSPSPSAIAAWLRHEATNIRDFRGRLELFLRGYGQHMLPADVSTAVDVDLVKVVATLDAAATKRDATAAEIEAKAKETQAPAPSWGPGGGR